jgi:FixJ family two-component response regulator
MEQWEKLGEIFVEQNQAFEKGFFDFVSKSVKETTLLARVKRAYEFSEKHKNLYLR